jgi:hypothetical protein
MNRRSQKEGKPVHALLATCTLTDELREFRDKTRARWSLNGLAREFGISRSYMKKLLRKRNPFPMTPRLIKRLRELQATTQVVPAHHRKRIIIYSRFPIPNQVNLFLRPRHCRGHNRPAIMSPNQVYCGTNKKQRATCQKLWRRRQRQIERRREKEKGK